MTLSTKIFSFAVAFLVIGCAPAGYYDSNGVYRSYGKSDSFRHDNNMAGTPATQPAPAPATQVETVPYTQAGYYDTNGNYITNDTAPAVPHSFFPPHGMCRIWFTDRPASAEPEVESCTDIQSRVPAGAYVIYGG